MHRKESGLEDAAQDGLAAYDREAEVENEESLMIDTAERFGYLRQ